MCIDMHGQECVFIHIRRISNKPARNYPDNTDKGCALICTVKNVYLYTFDVYPMNLQKITIQTKQTKKAHTCVQAKDMDSIHPNQSDNLQKMVKTKKTDKECTHMCATSKHGFYTSKSQV